MRASRLYRMTHAEIENGILPASGALGFDALHLPANRRSAETSWYDVFAIGDERFALTVGNVAGTPADAAAMIAAVRKAFAADAPRAVPRTLLSIAQALFRRETDAGAAFATAIVGIVDRADQTFTYVSAGHPPPFIRYQDGVVAALPSGGSAIGLPALDRPLAEVVVDLRDAALVVLYSGVLVQATKNVDEGLRRLHDVLADERMRHCSNPTAWIGRRMLGDVSHDDVALLALTFVSRRPATRPHAPATLHARPRWSVSWSFDATGPASTGARRAFLAALTSKTIGRAIDLTAAELIFGELLGNVVRHAPGLVEITLDWTDEFPVLHVRDNGPGFVSRRSRERLPADDLSESGRGLFIVNACATAFSMQSRPGRGTHARATLPAA